MKLRFSHLARCPGCAQSLRVTSFESRTIRHSPEELDRLSAYCKLHKLRPSDFITDVVNGILECRCGRWFPVHNGIPVLMSDALWATVMRSHREFFTRYESKLPSIPSPFGGSTTRSDVMQKKTGSSFGFQWLAFREMYPQYEQNFRNYLQGHLAQKDFAGKLVMDAGCGFGRHSYYAAQWGAEIVALDLSDAVHAAKEHLEPFALSHVVQSDLYHPPFAPRTFDLVFSIGVLHHLPDPKGGFAALVPFVKKGGTMFAWVYGKENHVFKIAVNEKIHAIAKHIPFSLLYYLCLIPAAIYHAVNLLYKGLNALGLKSVAKFLPFKYYAQFPFRVKHADAFDFLSTQVNNYYSETEFRTWFTGAGLPNATLTSFNGVSWRGSATV